MKWLLKLTTISGSILMFTACSLIGGGNIEASRQKVENSPQYSDGEFVNKLPVIDPPFMETMIKWIKGAENTVPSQPIEVKSLKKKDFPEMPPQGLRVTWFENKI